MLEMKELKFKDSKEFDDSCNLCIEKFSKGSSMFKRKITQGLYWTALDRDLANQFLRDERWLWGMKFWDTVKIIDHGGYEDVGIGKEDKGVGFYKSNK